MAGHGGRGVAPLLRHPLFVAAAGVYLAYQAATRQGHWVAPGWVASWLADALCMPVVLAVALAVQRAVRGLPQLVLPPSWLLGAWAFVSAWFELLAPVLRPARYTADWRDVLAYGLGTLAFAHWQNRPALGQ